MEDRKDVDGEDRDEESIDRELGAMGARPQIASAVKESLRRMKDGAAGPELAEMARDLLAGRISLRDLGSSSVYSEPLLKGVERYQRWESELTAEQRQALADEVQRHSDEAGK